MTAGDFIETIENPDKVRIVQQGDDVFVGFLGVLRLKTEVFDRIKGETVKKFRAIPEIRHRRWKELNLMRPLEPDETPDFSFNDLELKLYYTIHI
ncbi:MAG: hypothetical protein Q4C58_03800 [Eubacteriales bacterium]|nr:hypothetical protein [Eubacteriales bacterium]